MWWELLYDPYDLFYFNQNISNLYRQTDVLAGLILIGYEV